jgi:hypothetical protein
LAATEAGAQGPCGSSRAYAIIHLAMHDAYFGIHKNVHPTYLSGVAGPAAGANSDAAIAAAAHTTLAALYPAQRPFFDARHAAAGLSGSGVVAGHTYGVAVAQAMLATRAGDPDLGDAGYVSSLAPGHHRHDPDNAPQGYHAPYYGANAHCFAARTRHQPDAVPKLSDPEYLTALRQVRGKGIAPSLTGTVPTSIPTRAPDETVIGVFWAYDGARGLGTPPRLYNQIVREVADAQGNNVEKNARLFALVNADAGVLAWQAKYDSRNDFWRPVVGIREHGAELGPLGTGGNPIDSEADPFWLPLGAPATNEEATGGQPAKKNFTPPFPAYPSGHATFGSAAFQSVRRFYNQSCGYAPDNLAAGLSFVSDELNGINRDNTGTVRPRSPRTYSGGLWQMIEENSRSRVFLGLHWIFDGFAVDANGDIDLSRNVGGVPLGLSIADDIATNGLDESQRA